MVDRKWSSINDEMKMRCFWEDFSLSVPKIYLETTVFNFYYADDALDK